MTDKKDQKKVAKRWPVEARREDLRNLLREFGLCGLPSHRQLGTRYGCSKTMVTKDINKIVATIDPKHLQKIYFEFSEADKKILTEMRKFLRKGTFEQKAKASQVIIQLQGAFSDLDEKHGKRKKIPDKIELMETSPKIDQDIKKYASILKKLDEDEQRQLKFALLNSLDGGEENAQP